MISLQVRYALCKWHEGAIEFLGATTSDEVDGSHPTALPWLEVAIWRPKD
jgi:hypothetical protein